MRINLSASYPELLRKFPDDHAAPEACSHARERILRHSLQHGGRSFHLDANKRILRWNTGAEQILGLPRLISESRMLSGDVGESQSDRTLCSQNCGIHSSALKGVPQKNYDMLVMEA